MKRLTVLATLLLLMACSSEGASFPAPTDTATRTPTTTQSTTPTPAKTIPDFNADELALLKAAGWNPSDSGAQDFIDSAHDLCDTLDEASDEDVFEAIRTSTSDKKKVASQILLLLCDNSDRYVPLVVAVEIPEARVSGTYYVGDGAEEIKPGDYRTVGAVRDCYWVRKNKSGGIIANDLVSNAPGGVRITVKASDYEVSMDGCGIWIPHK